MKVLQFSGPFVSGQTITIPASIDHTYVHIGLQIPNRQPIGKVEKYSLPYSSQLHPTDVEINGKAYRIINNILEFDNLAQVSWEINILQDLPMGSVIDIVYKDSDVT